MTVTGELLALDRRTVTVEVSPTWMNVGAAEMLATRAEGVAVGNGVAVGVGVGVGVGFGVDVGVGVGVAPPPLRAP